MKSLNKPISITRNPLEFVKQFQEENKKKKAQFKSKLISQLMKTHKDYFKTKNYSERNLDDDISAVIIDLDLNALNYDVFVKHINNAIKDKLENGRELSCPPSLYRTTLSKKEISLSKSTVGSFKGNKDDQSQSKISNINNKSIAIADLKRMEIDDVKEVEVDELIPEHKKQKLKILRDKSDSEWAKLTLLDTIKGDERRNKEKVKKIETISIIQDALQQQIQQKQERKDQLRKEDKKLEESIAEIIKKKEIEEEKKLITFKQKLIQEKEIRDRFYQNALLKKQKDKEMDLLNDKRNLKILRLQAKEEEEKKRKKKQNEREILLKIIEDNNKNRQFVMENQELLREEKRKHFEEYSSILEKQQVERDLALKERKEKIKQSAERIGDLTPLKHEMIKKIMEEQRYEKEKIIQDQMIRAEEEKKNIKRLKLNEEINKANESLIKNKLQRINKEKTLQSSYDQSVNRSVELYNKEIESLKQAAREKNKKHFEELKKQIISRSMSNPFLMTEKERKLNSQLFNELGSKFNVN